MCKTFGNCLNVFSLMMSMLLCRIERNLTLVNCELVSILMYSVLHPSNTIDSKFESRSGIKAKFRATRSELVISRFVIVEGRSFKSFKLEIFSHFASVLFQSRLHLPCFDLPIAVGERKIPVRHSNIRKAIFVYFKSWLVCKGVFLYFKSSWIFYVTYMIHTLIFIVYGIEQPKLSQLRIEGSREFKPVLAKVRWLNAPTKSDPRQRGLYSIQYFGMTKKSASSTTMLAKWLSIESKKYFEGCLRADSSEVYTGSWTSYLEVVVKCDVDKRMDKADICRLLRFIRNKSEHFDELSEELKRTYYGCSEGVARYFNEKFPKLLLYTFQKKEELEQLKRNWTVLFF